MIYANITQSATDSVLVLIGALSFGIVVGYITYRTLARTTAAATISDISAVIGAVGGAAVLALWGPADGSMFAMYSIGLLVGMALYLFASLRIRGKAKTGTILGADGPLDGS